MLRTCSVFTAPHGNLSPSQEFYGEAAEAEDQPVVQAAVAEEADATAAVAEEGDAPAVVVDDAGVIPPPAAAEEAEVPAPAAEVITASEGTEVVGAAEEAG